MSLTLYSYATTILLLLIKAISPSAALDYDKSVCLQCIEEDCTYCRGSNFFNNPSECVCGEFSGFFGDCDDYSFGSNPYDTKRECEYDNENADTYFIVLVTLLPVLGLLICCCCICCVCGVGGICMCFQNSRTTDGAGPGTGTPHFNETQPTAPEPSAPLMSQSILVAYPVPPATAPVYHTHEAEYDFSANTGQSTFDSLKQGV